MKINRIIILAISLLVIGIQSPIASANEGVRSGRACISGATFSGHNFDNNEINRLTADGLKIANGSTNNYLKIDSGNILLSPDKNIVLGTAHGDICVSSGAVAFVMTSKEGLVIYDLRQNGPSQISIIINDKDKLVMEPGCVLVLTKEEAKYFEELDVPCHSVNYRDVIAVRLNEPEMKAYVAEFSFRSAMQRIQPLHELLISDSKKDIVLLEKIAKGMTVMGDFTTPAPSAELAVNAKENKKLSAGIEQQKLPASASATDVKNKPEEQLLNNSIALADYH